MTRIVHISDTHFGTEVPVVVEAIKQAIASVKPDIVVLSGDITQRARKSQFESAASFMAELPAKTKLAIPGNHDIPLFNLFTRFLSPYRNYKSAFGERQTIWCEGGLGIVNYDATSPYRHTRGDLTRAALLNQINAVKQQIGPDGIIIACAHQPLVTAWPEDQHETLIQRDLIAQLWSEHHVDLVLSGHVHVPLSTTTQPSFPHLSRHFILAGAGTAVSHRIRPGAPNSFNLIEVEPHNGVKSISVHLHVFDAAQSRFIPFHTAKFQPFATGWQQI